MSVKSHLTYGASVRPENAVTYSAGNEGCAHAYFSCIYAHDTPPRVQHFSAFHYTIDSKKVQER